MAKITSVTLYLALYNALQFAGWSLALYECCRSLQAVGGYASTYRQSGQTISEKRPVVSCAAVPSSHRTLLVDRPQGAFSCYRHWKSCMPQQVSQTSPYLPRRTLVTKRPCLLRRLCQGISPDRYNAVVWPVKRLVCHLATDSAGMSLNISMWICFTMS